MVKKRKSRLRKRACPWLPNVLWRYVPVEDLRLHPFYIQLKPREELTSEEDLQHFPQHTRVWELLHQGRLTTRYASAMLGLHEPDAARAIGLPKGLTSSSLAKEAFRHLITYQEPLSLNLLQVEAKDVSKEAEGVSPWEEYPEEIANHLPWLRQYIPRFPPNTLPKVRLKSLSDVRKAWGNAQESTGLLVAINHFCGRGQGCVVKECGMFAIGAVVQQYRERQDPLAERLGQLNEAGCKLGASPDGILVHNDGVTECIEVKCVCPFTSSAGGFVTDDSKFKVTHSVPIWYIPQLQLQMLCVGPTCRSVVLVVLCMKEALVFRVHRSDTLLELMLKRFNYFMRAFVSGKEIPKANFCSEVPSQEALFMALKNNKGKANLIACIAGDNIQRGKSGRLLIKG